VGTDPQLFILKLVACTTKYAVRAICLSGASVDNMDMDYIETIPASS